MNIAVRLGFCLNPPPGVQTYIVVWKQIETKGVEGGFWFCGKKLGKNCIGF
jgi:hypothetical protein